MNLYPPNKSWWLDAVYFTDKARKGKLPTHPAKLRTMEVHDQFEKDKHFDSWRKRFRLRSADLAKALSDYATTTHGTTKAKAMPRPIPKMDVAILETRLADHLTLPKKSNVFDPWVGWFFGKWMPNSGSGKDQYHIWDNPTTLVDGRELQFVTQTEQFGDFIYSIELEEQSNGSIALKKEAGNIQKALDHSPYPQVDIALDVYDKKTGITGWVSKYQSGKEWPHIGYLYDEQLLIWFAQAGNSNTGEKWWCFFERGNTKRCATIYDVTGVEVTVPASGAIAVEPKYGGYIQFYNQVPYEPAVYKQMNWAPTP